MKILVIGSHGKLGVDIVNEFKSYKDRNLIEIITPTSMDLDITNYRGVEFYIKSVRPDVIISTAGFIDINGCEENRKTAFHINSSSQRNLAKIAGQNNCRIFFSSTEFVFDGTKGDKYIESDVPNPQNVYGTSKYIGEMFVRNMCTDHYIIRSSSLFGKYPPVAKVNFIYNLIEKSKQKAAIEIYDNLFISPTYTVDAAKQICNLVFHGDNPGVYHIVNSGDMCTWYEFALYAAELLDLNIQIKPISYTHDKQHDPVNRPLIAGLDSEKFKLRSWKEAFNDFAISMKDILNKT